MTATIVDHLQAGDYGTGVVITITDQDGTVVNVSTATTKTITLRDPSGTSVTYAAALYTDGVDGKIVYTLQDGDVPNTAAAVGDWNVQGRVLISPGGWRTGTGVFSVLGNL